MDKKGHCYGLSQTASHRVRQKEKETQGVMLHVCSYSCARLSLLALRTHLWLAATPLPVSPSFWSWDHLLKHFRCVT
jgi:hypothetical protein